MADDADALAIAIAGLQASQRITDEFGGSDHVSGTVEAPWPHLVVTAAPGGDPGNLDLDRITESVALNVYGDPRGSIGPAECRRLAMIALRELATLPNRDVNPGDPVVAKVTANGATARLPLFNGQYGYTVGALVTVHPPRPTGP